MDNTIKYKTDFRYGPVHIEFPDTLTPAESKKLEKWIKGTLSKLVAVVKPPKENN